MTEFESTHKSATPGSPPSQDPGGIRSSGSTAGHQDRWRPRALIDALAAGRLPEPLAAEEAAVLLAMVLNVARVALPAGAQAPFSAP